ncbi:Nn.00g030830.m01.CDS01 [Neocucurbitaria sp. VM-36]
MSALCRLSLSDSALPTHAMCWFPSRDHFSTRAFSFYTNSESDRALSKTLLTAIQPHRGPGRGCEERESVPSPVFILVTESDAQPARTSQPSQTQMHKATRYQGLLDAEIVSIQEKDDDEDLDDPPPFFLKFISGQHSIVASAMPDYIA